MKAALYERCFARPAELHVWNYLGNTGTDYVFRVGGLPGKYWVFYHIEYVVQLL